MNTFSEAAGHKTNVQNSVVYLLIIKERAEEEIRGKNLQYHQMNQ